MKRVFLNITDRAKHLLYGFVQRSKWYLPQWMAEISLDREHRLLLKRVRAGAPRRAAPHPVLDPLWAFVLLQYNHHEVTRECIDSIGRLEGGRRSAIVIVDNGSTDGSADAVAHLYAGRDDIHVLRLARNEGYARGNNAGYRYARETLGATFVFMVNNDITFPDPGIIGLIEGEFRKSAFSVLGPDIVVPRAGGIHQNPIRFYFKTEADILRAIRKEEKRLAELEAGAKGWGPPEIRGHGPRSHRREGALVLHGAAFAFSPVFLEDFPAPFDEGTFLFGEEPILALRALSRGHKLVYYPRAVVEHHASASTAIGGYRDYWIFRLRNSIQSANAYLAELRRTLAAKASA